MIARYLEHILFSAALLFTLSCDTNVDARAESMDSPSTEDLNGIWGFAQNDVWAVGAKGTILHFDGSAWTQIDSGTTLDLFDIWGATPDDIWAVGGTYEEQAVFLHWDGVAWNDTTPGGEARAYISISGSSADDVYSLSDTTNGLMTLLHWNGSSWSSVFGTENPGGFDWTSVYVLSSDAIYITDFSGVHSFDETGWSFIDGTGWAPSHPAFGVFGTSTDNVFASCSNGIVVQHNGVSWDYDYSLDYDTHEDPNITFTVFGAIHGFGQDSIFTVGGTQHDEEEIWSGIIFHFNGTSWKEVFSNTTMSSLDDVWAASATRAFAVGNGGVIMDIQL
jgi:hypothetical protein